MSCKISIVIPVYNEALIVNQSIQSLITQLQMSKVKDLWQIILVENGSTDNTYDQLKALSSENISIIQLKKPNYGSALKTGIFSAKTDYIYTFNIDYWDISFIEKTLPLFEKNSIIIGSKGLPCSSDLRPLYRRLSTRIFVFLLKILFNYTLHDTHGIIAWKKKDIMEIYKKTRCFREIFDTALILTCMRKGLSVTEISVEVKEIRPSRSFFLYRAIKACVSLVLLRFDLWLDS
ncbi:glycosyltransferase family 2 protein [Elusimicrobiota bacterium]